MQTTVPTNKVVVETFAGRHNYASYRVYETGDECTQHVMKWNHVLENGEEIIRPIDIGGGTRVDRITNCGGKAVIEKGCMTVAEYMAS